MNNAETKSMADETSTDPSVCDLKEANREEASITASKRTVNRRISLPPNHSAKGKHGQGAYQVA